MKRADICKTITDLKGETGHKKILEVYNAQNPLPRGYRMQSDDPWCAATVSAVFLMNGYDAISECSCVMMIKKAKDLGIWVEDDAYVPDCGDIIMYDWQDQGTHDNVGVADHVGIVIGVSDNVIEVREGNYSKTIKNRKIKVNGKYIRGFIVPPYEDAETASEPREAIAEENTDNSTPIAEKPVETDESDSEGRYTVGDVYTVNVRSALNVRTGPGTSYPLVGYANLTADGKKHANRNGALVRGTRVTCNEIKENSSTDIWIKIPSGWICAVQGNKIYLK